jgi:hypothetical protein
MYIEVDNPGEAIQIPHWFKQTRMPTLYMPIRFIRLANWVVGKLPLGWTIKLYRVQGGAIVVFLDCRTGRETLFDPRSQAVALDYATRTEWFYKSNYHPAWSEELIFDRNSITFELDAIKYISTIPHKSLGSAHPIKVEFNGSLSFSLINR